MRSPTLRQQAEAIEQFGDDLAKLVNEFDRLCARMDFDTISRVNAIPHQDCLEGIAEDFRALGDELCRERDAAEEAADRRQAWRV